MARAAILLCLLVVLGVPFVARRVATREGEGPARPEPGTRTLIIITPHIEQIRLEFAAGFDRWHRRRFGEPVYIDWRQPGGTTEIRKQLEAQAQAAISAGLYDVTPPRTLASPTGDPLPEAALRAGAMEADLFFGGGSFEHTQAKRGIEATVPVNGQPTRVRVRIAARPHGGGFDQAWLNATYGPNSVGVERLYDPDQFWFGAALSGFGLVFNRDSLRDLGLPEPEGFADLADYRYAGLLAMADPRQSGSVATLYDSILNREGWERGWRILREMSANARYFAAASTQPPMDVGQGDAAAGVAIDFYGRGQAQALLAPGQDPATGRLGYVDPKGATYVDADPVTILAGAREPELARRFVEFVLSDQGQALWQFAPMRDGGDRLNPPDTLDPARRLGPENYRLRRMPVRRSIYERFTPWLTDKANPFEFASATPIKGWRDAIGPLMGAFAIDTSRELRQAWNALNRARGNTVFPPERLEEMERLFYALPEHPVLDDAGRVTRTLAFTPENYKAIAADVNRWRDPVRGTRAKIAYTRFFRENYAKIVELGRWQAP